MKKELYYYGVDKFNYKNSVLNIKGWICNKNKTKFKIDLMIKINNSEYIFQIDDTFLERKDMYEKNKDFLYLGYTCKLVAENIHEAEVYLYIDNRERIYIGKIKGNLFEKLIFIKRRLTFANIRKIYIKIIRRRTNEILSYARKPQIRKFTSDDEYNDYNSLKKITSIKRCGFCLRKSNKIDSDYETNVEKYNLFNSNLNYEKNVIVYFNHDIGGGATSYLNRIVREHLSNKKTIIIVRYNRVFRKYILGYKSNCLKINFSFNGINEIFNILNKANISDIYINELVTYPDLYNLLQKIMILKDQKCIKLTMLIHDYYCLCPTINLLNDEGEYCKLPKSKECSRCLKKNQFNSYFKYKTYKKWNIEWSKFLKKCDHIICFSASSKELMQKRYSLETELIPHKVEYIKTAIKNHKKKEYITIGLLGNLNYHKGIEKVKQLLMVIKKRNLAVNIVLIGTASETIEHPNFKETGVYDQDSIVKLTEENDIDIFLIASIWPETFSYTTQEIINMDMPIACFNFGAQAEKVINYKKGLVIENLEANNILDEINHFIKNNNR